MTAETDAVRVEVRDASPRRPKLRRPASDDIWGRGLYIVEMYSDEWGVTGPYADGKAVWSRFKIAHALEGAPC
ncbi:ATP-binding protein [Streptomyces sp. YGL11-2]|uniref:ATP-binding protein n=1 Tax=Streptomyces sp. YGL11-2 TaxID=3414028 RepID=UPI003CF53A8F